MLDVIAAGVAGGLVGGGLMLLAVAAAAIGDMNAADRRRRVRRVTRKVVQ